MLSNIFFEKAVVFSVVLHLTITSVTFSQTTPIDTNPSKIRIQIENQVDLNMIYIPPGKFRMGYDMPWLARHPLTSSSDGNASPGFIVTMTKGFYLGEDNINCSQYLRFINSIKDRGINEYTNIENSNPNLQFKKDDNGFSIIVDGDMPVSASWSGADEFCTWLTQSTQMTFRLPTEAEWEFALRGNKNENEPITDAGNNILKNGLKNMIHQRRTLPVKYFGNWVQDYFDIFNSKEKTDPQGPEHSTYKNRGTIEKETKILKSPKPGRNYSARFPAYMLSDTAGICGFRVTLDEISVMQYLQNPSSFPENITLTIIDAQPYNIP